MKQENEFGIRLNKYGVTDVDYYVAQGHKMRSEAIRAGFKAFKVWMIKVLGSAQMPDKAHSAPRRRAIQSDWPWVDMILEGTPKRKIGHV